MIKCVGITYGLVYGLAIVSSAIDDREFIGYECEQDPKNANACRQIEAQMDILYNAFAVSYLY